jgi:hypothetical protein
MDGCTCTFEGLSTKQLLDSMHTRRIGWPMLLSTNTVWQQYQESSAAVLHLASLKDHHPRPNAQLTNRGVSAHVLAICIPMLGLSRKTGGTIRTVLTTSVKIY